jgi:hypothetical protein
MEHVELTRRYAVESNLSKLFANAPPVIGDDKEGVNPSCFLDFILSHC